MGMRSVLIVLGLVSLTLAGCAPVYKTSYTYEAPENNDVRACTLDCRETQIECKQSEDREYRYCLDDFRFEQHRYERCRTIYRDNQDLRLGCHRPAYFCSRPNYADCEEAYAACYENCGAKVTREKTCVSNCEKQ